MLVRNPMSRKIRFRFDDATMQLHPLFTNKLQSYCASTTNQI